MQFNKHSIGIFISGVLVGVLLLSGFVVITGLLFYRSIINGSDEDQSGFISSIVTTVRQGALEQQTTSLYGKLKSIDNGMITVEAQRADGMRMLTFSYDESTQFIRLEHDEAQTQVPLSVDELVVDESISVTLDARLGNGEGRRATKVIKY